MKHLFIVFFGGVLFCSTVVQAAPDTIIYSQSRVTIIHHEAAPPTQSEKKEKSKEKEKNAVQYIYFNVDVRTEESLFTEGMFINPDFADNKALLISYDQQTTSPRLPEGVLSAVDIIFVTPEGEIVQIMPEVDLRHGTDAPRTPKKIKAVLLVAAGTTQKHKLIPGDTVEHELFQKPPVILN